MKEGNIRFDSQDIPDYQSLFLIGGQENAESTVVLNWIPVQTDPLRVEYVLKLIESKVRRLNNE